MDLATKQAFFLFFAIHLPPVEEGEFLLYIMLKLEELAEQTGISKSALGSYEKEKKHSTYCKHVLSPFNRNTYV